MTVLVASGFLATAPSPAESQLGSFGVQAGRVRSDLIGKDAPDSGPRHGALFGVYVAARTPLPWLGVRAGLSWVQRGGRYELAFPPSLGYTSIVEEATRTEYLTLVLAPALRGSLGPVSLFGYAGPSVDLLLGSHAPTAVLAPSNTAVLLQGLLTRPVHQAFAVVAGAGFEVRVPAGFVLGAEVRLSRGVSAAYRYDASSAHYRSTELVVRVGRRPHR